MIFSEYQELAGRTSGNRESDGEWRLTVAGLGVAGEAGEVADTIKKIVSHGHPLDRTRLAEELGDVLWYIAEVASAAGLDLNDVAEANIEKLTRRYPNGFSSERSLNRAE